MGAPLHGRPVAPPRGAGLGIGQAPETSLPRLLAFLLRLLSRTWRLAPPGTAPVERLLAQGPAVLALLHGHQLVLAALHRRLPIAALASRSRDGELAARTLHALGVEVVRGSASQGALSGARGALRALATGRSPAIAVDGPRGPAGRVHRGAAWLAERAGVPVVWATVRARPALRLPTWDRFLVPLPFARVELTYGRLHVERGRAEAARARLEAALRG